MTNIIGNNIKTLRDGMGLSQSVIARFINVDKSMISKVRKAKDAYRLICWRNLHGCLASQSILSKKQQLKHQAFPLASEKIICPLKIWKQSAP